MPAIINHKICDQASACGGIEVCPVGAFAYNEKTKRIEIDNEKCISCGACERTCPIGAIGIAKTWEEFQELKQAIEEDPRNAEDLFVDRFGGDVVNENVLVEVDQLEKVIVKSDNVIIELFNDDSIMCLLKSITYKDILSNCDFVEYYRCNVGEIDLKNYKVKELPALLVVRKGKVKKVVNGYYEEKDKERLFKLLK